MDTREYESRDQIVRTKILCGLAKSHLKPKTPYKSRQKAQRSARSIRMRSSRSRDNWRRTSKRCVLKTSRRNARLSSSPSVRMRLGSLLHQPRGLSAGSSDAVDASWAPKASNEVPVPVRSTGSNTCGASTKTTSYSWKIVRWPGREPPSRDNCVCDPPSSRSLPKPFLSAAI